METVLGTGKPAMFMNEWMEKWTLEPANYCAIRTLWKSKMIASMWASYWTENVKMSVCKDDKTVVAVVQREKNADEETVKKRKKRM